MRQSGPIGGAGLSLTPLRSLAIDRNVHPYGTPVWIDANDSLALRRADAVSPPDDCAGYRLCYHWRGAGGHLFRLRRRGRRSRGRHSACRRIRCFSSRRRGFAPVKESASSFSKGRLRRLSAEEIALWLEVAKTGVAAALPRSAAKRPPRPQRTKRRRNRRRRRRRRSWPNRQVQGRRPSGARFRRSRRWSAGFGKSFRAGAPRPTPRSTSMACTRHEAFVALHRFWRRRSGTAPSSFSS